MGFFYTVKKGDHMAKLAHAHGIRDWQALYDHPANEPLRELRPDPSLLAPGDQVYIPRWAKAEHPRATDQRHTFELPARPVGLHIVVRASDGTPLANTACTLVVGDQTIETTTNGDGAVIHDDLPPQETRATLEIDGRTLPLLIGHLDPCDRLSGVQGRLRNLGYYQGPCHGELDDPTRAAIQAFKVDHDLGQDDLLTPEVRDALRDEYGV